MTHKGVKQTQMLDLLGSVLFGARACVVISSLCDHCATICAATIVRPLCDHCATICGRHCVLHQGTSSQSKLSPVPREQPFVGAERHCINNAEAVGEHNVLS